MIVLPKELIDKVEDITMTNYEKEVNLSSYTVTTIIEDLLTEIKYLNEKIEDFDLPKEEDEGYEPFI